MSCRHSDASSRIILENVLGVQIDQDGSLATVREVASIDLNADIGAQSSITIELAQSSGMGPTRNISDNGGLDVAAHGGEVTDRANAARLDAHLDHADLGISRPGSINIVVEQREAGFQTTAADTPADQTQVRIEHTVELNDKTTLSTKLDHFESDAGN